MPTITRDQVRVPADVMPEARENYIENYMKATRGTGRLMLFACDQKIEHLNKDFYGEGIDPSDLEPEHLFEIGSKGTIGILAGQRGLIAQYANDYPEINYLVKMNSKTNLVKGAQDDPYSPQLYDLEAVLAMKDAGVNIVGIGYTIYLGSEYESTMMAEAGELIAEAHAQGLIVVLWIYPRGKAVPDEKDPDLIAGAAGVALCLGADFVKVRLLLKASRSLRPLLVARAWFAQAVLRKMLRSSCPTFTIRSTLVAHAATQRVVISICVRPKKQFALPRLSLLSRWVITASKMRLQSSMAKRISPSKLLKYAVSVS